MLPKTEIKRPWFWFLWTVATALSWALVVYPGLNIRELVIPSWQVLPEIAWALFLSTIALGLFVGLFQYLVLRVYTIITVEWIIISAFSYALGSALGLLLIASLAGVVWPEVFSGTQSAILPIPLAFTMLAGGAIAGLIQAYTAKYKYTTVFQSNRKILLWVLATALGWGLGFYATSYAWGTGLPIYVQSGLAGLIIGAITGLALLLQFEPKQAS